MLKLLEIFGKQARLYAPHDQIIQIAAKLGIVVPDLLICRNPAQQKWGLVVVDNFKTSLSEAQFFLTLGRVVALDEGGDARNYFPYLIDLLPSLPEQSSPNESNNGFLPLPAYVGGRQYPPKKILISFGGQDEERLTEVVGQLLDSFNLKHSTWDVVKGSLFKRTFAWPGVPIIENVDVKTLVANYDLVFTHFGLTAFEALSSGASVILLNPTLYHHKLAQNAGFATLGIKKVDKARALQLYQYLIGEGKSNFVSNVQLKQQASLEERLIQLKGEAGGCPACIGEAERFGKIIYRNYDKSYAICPTCGLIYQEIFYKSTINYNENYFFEDYKAQYGKTYLEDFDHIKLLGKRRLKYITRKLRTGGKKLLDIGCAYGAFMQVATEQNFEVYGLDASSTAVNYVTKNLKMSALKATLPKENPYIGQKFDVVSLWFVIEHFKHFDAVMRGLSANLKLGGVLAFATPKGDGLTAKMNSALFFHNSPQDHYIIFTQKNAQKLLARYGFKIYAVRTTGVHPERQYQNITKYSFLYKVLKAVFKLQGKGDTFEVFAQKVSEID
jgi:2-polyprenyl-3-methyl-5-hydroxy-6-metoxy-1,4-benzoquinol methylase